MRNRVLIGALCLGAPVTIVAQARQTSADEYTRYEMLAPGTAQFKITYDVTATTAGATAFFNPIRKGSTATDESVWDPATGRPLPWTVVPGAEAKTHGYPEADAETDYIRVALPRPVPANGEIRIRIVKTYRDPKSYVAGGDTVAFIRSLSIKFNAVVLPPGFELIGVDYPSQVLTEADGRVKVSFMNPGADEVSYMVRGRKVAAGTGRAGGVGFGAAAGAQPQPGSPVDVPAARLVERAAQTREIVYFLQQPETHAFDLYHDYTETRPEVGQYLNVVRAGSRVSNPSAVVLDTGAPLATKTLKGAEITAAGVAIDEPVTAETEVVVIPFPPPPAGGSTRLRISETYTDPARYRLEGDDLVWDRAFGRARNAVVLPAGWRLTHSSIPGVVSITNDGRVRLDFTNGRPDEIQVLIVARRR